MNRRSFIKNSAFTAGAFLLPPFVTSFDTFSPSRVQVIIIGAGLAGLAAAYRLKQKGISFIILESRNRIGGRVFSHQLNDGLVIELGGEWVGNSHTRVQELCDEFGLILHNNQMDTHLIYKGQYSPKGKWSYSKEWEEKFKAIVKNYETMTDADKRKLDKYDWWRFMVNNGCNGRDLDIRELLDSTDFGESIRHVSAFAALSEYAESSEKNEMDKKIKGGNKKLAEALADKIGVQNVLTDHHVHSIRQTNDKVTVICSNGKSIVADKLICAIPTFAVSKIKWDPVLPEEYTQAINELQYARINKHALHFSKKFWRDEDFDLVTDRSPHYFYHATKYQSVEEGVLIAYSIGDKAALNANQSNEVLAQDVFSCLQPHFGDVSGLLRSQVNYYWGNDPYSRGAYALYGVGQWYGLMPVLKKSFMRTHFAGEHIADWQGFMEGAVNSGEEAADMVSA